MGKAAVFPTTDPACYCNATREGCLQKKRIMFILINAFKRGCVSRRVNITHNIRHAGVLINSVADMGSIVILRTVSCLFFIWRIRALSVIESYITEVGKDL